MKAEEDSGLKGNGLFYGEKSFPRMEERSPPNTPSPTDATSRGREEVKKKKRTGSISRLGEKATLAHKEDRSRLKKTTLRPEKTPTFIPGEVLRPTWEKKRVWGGGCHPLGECCCRPLKRRELPPASRRIARGGFLGLFFWGGGFLPLRKGGEKKRGA